MDFDKKEILEVINKLKKNDETTWIEIKFNNVYPEKIGETISALANSGFLSNQNYAYMIFGIKDQSWDIVGSKVDLTKEKYKQQDLKLWLSTHLKPCIDFEFFSFILESKKLSIIKIETIKHTPVQFKSTKYIRIKSHNKKLNAYPEEERKIWSKLDTLLYKTEEKINKSDIELFKQIVSQIKKTIEFIRYRDFGSSHKNSDLKDLVYFEVNFDSPEYIFLDKVLENVKKKLFKSIGDFNTLIALNTYPKHGDFYSIPDELSDNYPEQFRKVQLEINEGAKYLCECFDKFVVEGKKRNISLFNNNFDKISDKKPMNIESINEIISTSSQNEWLINDEDGLFIYKTDLSLIIERDKFENYESFSESWAKNHPDNNSTITTYFVKYNGIVIIKKRMVNVDGYRATLPLPKSSFNLKVNKEDVNFARIIDVTGRLFEYLERSNIKIENSY